MGLEAFYILTGIWEAVRIHFNCLIMCNRAFERCNIIGLLMGSIMLKAKFSNQVDQPNSQLLVQDDTVLQTFY